MGFVDGLDVGIRGSRMTARIVAVASRRIELQSIEMGKAKGGEDARGRSRV